MGADGVELDVQLEKNGELVIGYDERIDRKLCISKKQLNER